jgi:hypothetical protein
MELAVMFVDVLILIEQASYLNKFDCLDYASVACCCCGMMDKYPIKGLVMRLLLWSLHTCELPLTSRKNGDLIITHTRRLY